MSHILLSICIPTFNRAYILKSSLESLTSQPEFLETNLIEIVISDNNSSDNTEMIVSEFIEKFPSKVKYHRNVEDIMELNFEKALSLGQGTLLKLHNDSLQIKPGAFTEILKVITACDDEKPLIFFLNGKSKNNDLLTICNNLNEFIEHVSFNCTWIGGFSIWKYNFDQLNNFSARLDSKLIQTDVILKLITNNKRAVVLNDFYFPAQSTGPKGFYDLGLVFGKNYLNILKQYIDDNLLNIEIFESEKKKVFFDLIIPYYFNSEHKFNEFGFLNNLNEYYLNSYFIEFLNEKIKDNITVDTLSNTPKISSIALTWRSINNHNETYLIKDFNFLPVTVGNHTYGPLDVSTFGNSDESLHIGNFVSIAEEVKFILGGNHSFSGFSSFPFLVKFFENTTEAWTKGPIIIKDDVWIGYGATILSGVTIGQGAVIAAKSVVTKDVPPYAIVAGNPSKIIKYRFNQIIINKLLLINFSNLTKEKINVLSEYLYLELNEENIDDFISKF